MNAEIDAGNNDSSLVWITKAAKQGDAAAQFNLGNRYNEGEGVAKNYTKAVYWYTKAAELGHANAQCNLGNRYYEGKGTKKDYTKAAYWYTKAAEQDHAVAQNNLGHCYQYGQGVTKDFEKAVYWYKKAAQLNNLKNESGIVDYKTVSVTIKYKNSSVTNGDLYLTIDNILNYCIPADHQVHLELPTGKYLFEAYVNNTFTNRAKVIKHIELNGPAVIITYEPPLSLSMKAELTIENNWEEIYNRLKNLREKDSYISMCVFVNMMNFGESVMKSCYNGKIESICSAGKLYTRVYLLKSDVLLLMHCIEQGDCGDSEGFGVEPDTWMASYIDKTGNTIVPFDLSDSKPIKEAVKIYGSI